jgi:hypothetical protein
MMTRTTKARPGKQLRDIVLARAFENPRVQTLAFAQDLYRQLAA